MDIDRLIDEEEAKLKEQFCWYLDSKILDNMKIDWNSSGNLEVINIPDPLFNILSNGEVITLDEDSIYVNEEDSEF